MKKQLYILLYAGLLWFVFLGASDSIMYNNTNIFIRWLPFVITFGVLLFLLYKIIQPNNAAFVIAIVSVVIVGPALGIFMGFKQDKELKESGKTTFGVVYRKWQAKRHEPLLRCYYSVNGKHYSTFSETDRKNLYKCGDTLHILYSERNPENAVILELRDK